MSAPSARTIVLAALRELSTETAQWWPATALAHRVRLPPDQVRRVLAKLAAYGVIERVLFEEAGCLLERWRLTRDEERRAARAGG
jgi:DNA-binding IscR family transcriptional regulator